MADGVRALKSDGIKMPNGTVLVSTRFYIDLPRPLQEVLKQGIPILKYVLSIAHPSSWSRNCSNRKIEILLDGHTDRMSEDEFFCEKDYSKLYKRLFGK